MVEINMREKLAVDGNHGRGAFWCGIAAGLGVGLAIGVDPAPGGVALVLAVLGARLLQVVVG